MCIVLICTFFVYFWFWVNWFWVNFCFRESIVWLKFQWGTCKRKYKHKHAIGTHFKLYYNKQHITVTDNKNKGQFFLKGTNKTQRLNLFENTFVPFSIYETTPCNSQSCCYVVKKRINNYEIDIPEYSVHILHIWAPKCSLDLFLFFWRGDDVSFFCLFFLSGKNCNHLRVITLFFHHKVKVLVCSVLWFIPKCLENPWHTHQPQLQFLFSQCLHATGSFDVCWQT